MVFTGFSFDEPSVSVEGFCISVPCLCLHESSKPIDAVQVKDSATNQDHRLKPAKFTEVFTRICRTTYGCISTLKCSGVTRPVWLASYYRLDFRPLGEVLVEMRGELVCAYRSSEDGSVWCTVKTAATYRDYLPSQRSVGLEVPWPALTE